MAALATLYADNSIGHPCDSTAPVSKSFKNLASTSSSLSSLRFKSRQRAPRCVRRQRLEGGTPIMAGDFARLAHPSRQQQHPFLGFVMPSGSGSWPVWWLRHLRL
ncbi:hypothetical protein EJB05_38576 [Eragrostis curvula]|uniref:Uncharacterized protein n=1 Tax=Eragrostis curvula TaxID=38414 RepID=A0A5J9TUM3_9POAL|nr:hypothetical protein EJB05_38575 [Eragrostis curvula]TVU15074.1 hypothetical protein EJB05_38576 [Eragrostis curvula]